MIGNEERARAAAVLDFWFNAPGTQDHDRPREVWFTVDPAFDTVLRERFLADQQRAAAGGHDAWGSERDLCLALILLLDQFPRNLYRGSPQAFASDAKARAAARQALKEGFDRALPPVRRSFVYLPFEHSEDLADQTLSVRLFAAMPPGEKSEKQLWYARRHYEIIARFSRFPHRNHMLGRVSTPAEEAFLKEPDSSF